MSFCKCGCKQTTNNNSAFIHGHNTRLNKLPQRFTKGMTPWNKGKHGVYVLSDSTKEKISIANKGKHIMPPAHLAKMLSARRQAGWKKGWKHSPETLRKIGLALTGHPSTLKGKRLPEAWRQHISEGRKGMMFSDSHRENIRKARAKQSFTPETRHKLSISLKRRSVEGRWVPPFKGKKIPVHLKIRWAKLAAKAISIRPTSLEQIIIDVIKENHLPFKYTGDGKFFIGSRNPDFIDTMGRKICVEARPKKTCPIWNSCSWQEYKQKKVTNYKKYKWKCLFLWWEDIKSNPEIIKKTLSKQFPTLT